jgi:hypothetical protein
MISYIYLKHHVVTETLLLKLYMYTSLLYAIIYRFVVSCLEMYCTKRTYVLYHGTFGASDQGQTLDV